MKIAPKTMVVGMFAFLAFNTLFAVIAVSFLWSTGSTIAAALGAVVVAVDAVSLAFLLSGNMKLEGSVES